MKIPKKVRRFCPYCNEHTEQKISISSSGRARGSLKKGSPKRARRRGSGRGYGNLGRYSKPAISKWKRKTKSTKKTNISYTCLKCKKSVLQKKGIRVSRIMFKEK